MRDATRGTSGAELSDPAELAARRALLGAPHMLDLTRFAAGLRAAHGEVPDFDPLDGGTGARLFLLLETPGPTIGRTGLVSADNPTGTGRNLRRFLDAAGILRGDRVVWNAVPWYIHAGGPNRAPRTAELRAGLSLLPPLLDLLPRLRVAVLAGRAAAGAEEVLRARRPGMPVLRMPHPSPTYVCTSPDVARRIGAALAEAAVVLGRVDAAG